MFSDPQFWVAVAFLIFILAIFKPIKKIINSSLDNKILEIKASIEEAENLKNETQITLNEIKKRQSEVELEVKEIHSKAKSKIKILESQSEIKLSELISKKQLLAELKIEQLSRDANIIVQQQITQTATKAALTVLEKKLNDEEKQKLIDQSIKDLGSALKN